MALKSTMVTTMVGTKRMMMMMMRESALSMIQMLVPSIMIAWGVALVLECQ